MDGLHSVALCESVDSQQRFVRAAASAFTVEYGSPGKVCPKHCTVYSATGATSHKSATFIVTIFRTSFLCQITMIII
jgi:hypothetical protein